ncbi:MAG: helix-turn-helix domain-containing protein [Phascolarctobacterium faecium]
MGRKAFDNSIDYKEIGTRIRIMRLKLAVSQTECASKLGISQTHLSNIEHGRSGITLQMLCRVCDILQVSLIIWSEAQKNRRKKAQRDHDRRSCAGHKNAEGYRRKVSPADSKFIIKKSKPFWFALLFFV